MTDWRDISTAPKDGTRVDIWLKPHDAMASGYFKDGDWWFRGNSGKGDVEASYYWEVTHWMPRPAAPGSAPVPSLVDDAIDALRKWNAAFEGLFAHCVSNGVFNAWGRRLNCTKLNEAHEASNAVIWKADKAALPSS
jgi:hypothetical protein